MRGAAEEQGEREQLPEVPGSTTAAKAVVQNQLIVAALRELIERRGCACSCVFVVVVFFMVFELLK